MPARGPAPSPELRGRVPHQLPLVVDFFGGMGGLSVGFAREHYRVLGLDAEWQAVETYQANVGPARRWDARQGYPSDLVPDVIVGGPPCRPWSVVNQTTRGDAHRDFHLLRDFVNAIVDYRPEVVAIENVPAAKNELDAAVDTLRTAGFSAQARTVCYAEWGAPSRRRRRFVLAVASGSVERVWMRLEAQRRPPQSVRDAIEAYVGLPFEGFPDHEWGRFRTIARYADKYASGKYGWSRLSWDEPAPSFGNVSKTYVLHPSEDRVVSVREAIGILGFPDAFVFPDKVSRTSKYRMAADAVSPQFSEALARAIRQHLRELGRWPSSLADELDGELAALGAQ